MSPNQYDRACAQADLVIMKTQEWLDRLTNPTSPEDVEAAFELAIERVFTDQQMQDIANYIRKTCNLDAEFRAEARRFAEREVYGKPSVATSEEVAWEAVK